MRSPTWKATLKAHESQMKDMKMKFNVIISTPSSSAVIVYNTTIVWQVAGTALMPSRDLNGQFLNNMRTFLIDIRVDGQEIVVKSDQMVEYPITGEVHEYINTYMTTYDNNSYIRSFCFGST